MTLSFLISRYRECARCLPVRDQYGLCIHSDYTGKDGNAEQHVFVLAIREYMHRHADVPLRGIHMFWSRMDKRVSKGLYNGYTEIFRSLKLPVLETVIPSAERYNKDSGMKGPVPQHLVPSISLRSERKRSGPVGSGNRNRTETSIKQLWLPKEERITKWTRRH